MEEIVRVELGERTYSIHIGSGTARRLGHLVRDRLGDPSSAVLVTDDRVGPLHAQTVYDSLASAGFRVLEATIPAGEGSKTLREASMLYDRLSEAKADRNTVVVAVGGGVVGDLAGFVAATFARGLAFVQVPTTLLAMVDASVGGKVAVDHPLAKNMIGAFHQPKLVVCDLETLSTLPPREYRCGLAEVCKHGAALDAELFQFLEERANEINAKTPEVLLQIVAWNCRIKGSVVEKDEFERTGLRSILNYGHTFAHAFETAAGYESLLHGEAVAIGMTCAALAAEKLGRTDGELGRRQDALWRRLGLPTRIPREIAAADLVATMQRDKKATAGRLNLVLPERVGCASLVRDIEPELVRQVILERTEG